MTPLGILNIPFMVHWTSHLAYVIFHLFFHSSEEPHHHDALGPIGATLHLLGATWRFWVGRFLDALPRWVLWKAPWIYGKNTGFKWKTHTNIVLISQIMLNWGSNLGIWHPYWDHVHPSREFASTGSTWIEGSMPLGDFLANLWLTHIAMENDLCSWFREKKMQGESP